MNDCWWKTFNQDRQKFLDIIWYLKERRGYTDLGFANAGNEFTLPEEHRDIDKMDISMYNNKATDVVYVEHTVKEILHVDMSD